MDGQEDQRVAAHASRGTQSRAGPGLNFYFFWIKVYNVPAIVTRRATSCNYMHGEGRWENTPASSTGGFEIGRGQAEGDGGGPRCAGSLAGEARGQRQKMRWRSGRRP